MSTFRQRISSGWNMMRMIRLGLGLWLLVVSVQARDMAMILLSAFLVLTAAFGVGCCGVNGCYVQPGNDGKESPDEVDYDEIK